ncbi:Kelch domain-containing protein 4 [Porphyridium purpureum]|uniref:Kelch domain-containing protein 4 n=1 Tax=Porphyridium purpureum TaxID=35688 RepID=A0A5J4YUE9_PORPP|nr:Kelch domain-containing protein 4 [Porphyridium purpureum]|eukprot:POR6708..scf227_4
MVRENASERRKRREVRKSKKAKKERNEQLKESRRCRSSGAAHDDDDIDALLKELESSRRKLEKVTITALDGAAQPALRYNGVFVAHPTDDALILHGGERYDGDMQHVFDDLSVFNIKKNSWKEVQSPLQPSPRCGHAGVTRSAQGGQLVVFGGEFASRSGSVFRHYSDLWVLDLSTYKWECVYGDAAPSASSTKQSAAPSARSGHRMAFVEGGKKVVIFGGYFDNGKSSPRYFADCFLFDMDLRLWIRVDIQTGFYSIPVRSACLFLPHVPSTGRSTAEAESVVILGGGYARVRQKGENDKSVCYQDMYKMSLTAASAGDTYTVRYESLRPTGQSPLTLQGLRMAQTVHGDAFGFGGVQEIELDETSIQDVFSCQLVGLSVTGDDRLRWFEPSVGHGKMARSKEQGKQERRAQDAEERKTRRRRRAKASSGAAASGSTMTPASASGASIIIEPASEVADASTTGAHPENPGREDELADVMQGQEEGQGKDTGLWPCPRANAGVAIKGRNLYIYGGYQEVGERQVVLSDLLTIDVSKLDEWLCLQESQSHTWLGSDGSSTSSSSESDSSSE